MASWSIQPFGHNSHGPKIRGMLCPFFGGGLGLHLIQCGLGRGLPLCQVSSWSIQPVGHNTPMSQTDRQDNGPISYNIGWTILQPFTQEYCRSRFVLFWSKYYKSCYCHCFGDTELLLVTKSKKSVDITLQGLALTIRAIHVPTWQPLPRLALQSQMLTTLYDDLTKYLQRRWRRHLSRLRRQCRHSRLMGACLVHLKVLLVTVSVMQSMTMLQQRLIHQLMRMRPMCQSSRSRHIYYDVSV